MSHFRGPPSVPDQAIDVVLGAPLTGGDFKDVGSAEQQLLGVSVGHHLPRGPEKGFVLRRDHCALPQSSWGPQEKVPAMSQVPGRGAAQHALASDGISRVTGSRKFPK